MSSEDKKHRSHLPIPSPERTGLITYDAKDPDTKFPPIEQLRPPGGAPNVLLILIDDAGFGSSSAFGGPCQTPNAEKLAAAGLKYNRFHTTALCSPTRAALLTGRNHHSAGMGGITEIATGAPGYSSVLPNTISPLARTLKLNGYSTAQFGKCHEVPVWETSPVGPFDAWPTGGGEARHPIGAFPVGVLSAGPARSIRASCRTRSSPITTGCRRSWRWRAMRSSKTSC
jgi:arylsulfatase